jgi:hypothetical protein
VRHASHNTHATARSLAKTHPKNGLFGFSVFISLFFNLPSSKWAKSSYFVNKMSINITVHQNQEISNRDRLFFNEKHEFEKRRKLRLVQVS